MMVLIDNAELQRDNHAIDNGDQTLGAMVKAIDDGTYFQRSQLVTIEDTFPQGVALSSGVGLEDGTILTGNIVDVAQTSPHPGVWELSVAPDVENVLIIAEPTGARAITSSFSGVVAAPRPLVFSTDIGLNLQDPNPATHVFLSIRQVETGTANPNNGFQIVNTFCGSIPISGITARNRLMTSGNATTFDTTSATVCSEGRGKTRTLVAPFP